MRTVELREKLAAALPDGLRIDVYPDSVNSAGNAVLFIGGSGESKSLFILEGSENELIEKRFKGGELVELTPEAGAVLARYPLNHANATAIQNLFPFTKPILIGLDDSIGLGDRLGLANPGHLRAIRGSHMKPILAQQSIRELARTEREPEDVMDSAVWAVFQEGYRDGFGADADHLKTTEDIDRLVSAGFTMFTLDPGEHVVDEADALSMNELESRARKLRFERLGDDVDVLVGRYTDSSFNLSDNFVLRPEREAVLRALVKYGGVIEHAVSMYRHLENRHPSHAAEIELSVDETEAVTTPFEHFFVMSELKRLGVSLISLAPRFAGQFEKGIDYIGDLDLFKSEYIKHLAVAEYLGPYKISIHSGSDKFSIYETIAALGTGHVHIKTAGTSYLEALKTIALTDPALFREILDFSREHYDIEKRTYHVSGKVEAVPAASECSDVRLLALFKDNDARQVLHVTFGKVLTQRTEAGAYRFRSRVLACLQKHEELHYQNLQVHLGKHVAPFN